MPNEPSMEEILSSIKRIIAEEDKATPTPRAPKRGAPSRIAEAAPQAGAPVPAEADADDQILELTEVVPADAPMAAPKTETAKTGLPKPAAPKVESRPEPKAEAGTGTKAAPSLPKPEAKPARPREAAAAPTAQAETATTVLSDLSAKAARDSFDHLSKLLVRGEDAPSNTLEDLVREMLRPMLKDWLDANLPTMVEALVKREIDRITGRV